MRKFMSFILSLITAFTPVVALAQQPEPAQNATPAIRVQTRVVLADVIATDNSGKPVTDLKPEDFTVEEAGHKQKVTFFSLEQPSQAQLPQLPPGVYSNRPEYNAPTGPLTVILIDSLNTPLTNQPYVRDQLIRYAANQLSAGQRVAVYGLANRLTKLADFTNDPMALRLAIEGFTPVNVPTSPQASSGTTRSSGTIPNMSLEGKNDSQPVGGLTTGANLQAQRSQVLQEQITMATQAIRDFQEGQNSYELQVRMGTTVEALRQLTKILSGYPGRKNLVWVAALFPFLLVPEDTSIEVTRAYDPTAPAPLPIENSSLAYANQTANSFNDEIRKTTTMLSESEVAIYPVDARGLFNGSDTADASTSGLNSAGLLRMGNEYGRYVAAGGQSAFSTQAVMADLAQQSGGKFYINRNDIDRAVALASADGGVYYVLGYYPEKKRFDGEFRKIKVTTSRPGVHLRHRTGYFAIDTTKSDNKQREAETASTLRSAANSTMVYFDALVQPPTQPANPAKVPVKFRLPANSFTSEESKGGQRKINLEFYSAVFSKEGKLLQAPHMTVNTTLEADQYAQVQQKGLIVPMEVQLAPGNYDLRLAVRDNRTGYLGSLTAPVSIAKP